MPAEYPFKPPAFVMLTPSGRFETGTKICLSISSFHPESWQPSWSVRSALVALIAFMQTPGNGAVGSIDTAADVRKQIAKEARTTPPKHANSDIQELINAQHQRMLNLEEESKNLYSRGGSPLASSVVEVEAIAEEATTLPPAVSEEIEEEEDQTPLFKSQETTTPPTTSSPFHAAVEEPTATPTREPESPLFRSPPLRSSPSLPTTPTTSTTGAEESSSSWEDKGLSFVAVLLGAIILAVLLRRMVLAFAPAGGRGSSSDPLLFSVNPSADFDIEL